ncbi:hypothetical protein H5T89_07085 [bacterium]|nr:hypothetical protein [bacterium]
MEKILICTRLFRSSFLVEDPLKEIRVSISPPIIELSLAPQTEYNFSVSFVNLSNMELKVKSSISPFIFEENGTLVILEEPDKWSCKDWIMLEDAGFTVSSGDTYLVKGRIFVPSGVVGGRHSAITFDINSSESVLGGMGVKIKTGTLIFVSVPSTEKRYLVVDSFTIEKNTSEEVIFSMVVRNLGNTYLKIEGDVTIKDADGKRIRTIPLKDVSTVLPDGKRIIRTVWRHPKPGDFTAYLKVNYGLSGCIEEKVSGKVGYGI